MSAEIVSSMTTSYLRNAPESTVRMLRLLQEAGYTVSEAKPGGGGSHALDLSSATSADLIALLTGRGPARRLAELARVTGLGATGDYDLVPAITTLEHTGASA